MERKWNLIQKDLGLSKESLQYLKKKDKGKPRLNITVKCKIRPPKTNKHGGGEFHNGKLTIWPPKGFSFNWKTQEGDKGWFYNFMGVKIVPQKTGMRVKLGTYTVEFENEKPFKLLKEMSESQN